MAEHAHMDHSAHHPAAPAMAMATMDHGDHMDHMNMGNSSTGHMMMMYFHFGVSEVILFDFWRISTVLGLLGSMLGIFLMAGLYEGLKVAREYLQQRDMERQLAAANPSTNGKVLSGRCAPFSVGHIVQTVLHMVQIVVSYFLMLIAMTYNVWLFIAVVAGAGVGYFLFAWRRRITLADSFEHCH